MEQTENKMTVNLHLNIKYARCKHPDYKAKIVGLNKKGKI